MVPLVSEDRAIQILIFNDKQELGRAAAARVQLRARCLVHERHVELLSEDLLIKILLRRRLHDVVLISTTEPFGPGTAPRSPSICPRTSAPAGGPSAQGRGSASSRPHSSCQAR